MPDKLVARGASSLCRTMITLKKEVYSLFWVLAGILFLRTFVFEPFQIPTGSMIPTLEVGDHLLVAKSAYDFKVPFTQKSILTVSDPKAGDVIVFEYPNYENDPRKKNVFYIKRVVGIPGDIVSLNQSKITINSKTLEYRDASLEVDKSHSLKEQGNFTKKSRLEKSASKTHSIHISYKITWALMKK